MTESVAVDVIENRLLSDCISNVLRNFTAGIIGRPKLNIGEARPVLRQ